MKPTIYDVAKRARVSTATVSRALNGTSPVAPPTRQRIERAVRALGYRPNTIARSLVTKATHTIALLMPDITNPFFPDLVKGVQLLADERGYTVLLCSVAGDAAREAEYLEMLSAKQVDGALLVGIVSGRDTIARFARNGVPIVSLDRNIDYPGAPLVQVNHRKGARIATEHLLQLGHRLVAHLSGPIGLRVSHERLAGYREALRQAGIAYDPRLVVSGDFTEEAGYEGIEALLGMASRFSAVFAANDLAAIGATAALKDRDRRVPEDVSVVGFDDIRLAMYTSPALTTIRQPTYEMGRRATELLVDAIHSRTARRGQQVIFEGELIVRASSMPMPAAMARQAETVHSS